MPKFTETGFEKLNWSQQSWSDVMTRNMQLLEDTFLKVSGMVDVDLTGLADGDVLQWNQASQKFKRVQWLAVFTPSEWDSRDSLQWVTSEDYQWTYE